MCKPTEQPLPHPSAVGVMEALKAAYDRKVVPSEKRYLYDAFDTPPLRDQEFFGKPTILLLGQYSVGKTSMISYLLNGNYPGADIGPEPTTDIFAHVDFSEKSQTISGITLASDNTYQFQSLSMFGDVFLNKLRATRFNAPLLKHISIIDTPGILTGDKQVENRGYDFAQVIKFLSNKVDCIFLIFDANKLDISDEYKQVIQILKGNEDKVKIILNKADSVTPRELVHVRGALMWGLGKIMSCPEVPKVYIGSFWPYWSDKNTLLRDAIKDDLAAVIKEITDLPNSFHHKRVNDVVKRARNLRIHSYVMDEIVRRKLFFSKTEKAPDTETQPQKLHAIYRTLAMNKRIVLSDFPDPEMFHNNAKKTQAKYWARIDPKLEKLLNSFIENDISPIVNAALNEKKNEVSYRIPKKLPLPEDYNKLVNNKKLAQFLPESQPEELMKKTKKKASEEVKKDDSKQEDKAELSPKKSQETSKGEEKQASSKQNINEQADEEKQQKTRKSLQRSKKENEKSNKSTSKKDVDSEAADSKKREEKSGKAREGENSDVQKSDAADKSKNQKENEDAFA